MTQLHSTARPGHPAWQFTAKLLSFAINPNFCQFFIYIYLRRTTDPLILGLSLLCLAALPLVGYVIYVRSVLGRDNLYVLERRKRLVPFVINIASVLLFVYLLQTTRLGAGRDPAQMDAFADFLIYINALTAVITLVWRISIHMIAAAASFVLLLSIDTGFVVSATNLLLLVLLVGVGWSRWHLRGHTTPQIVGGTFVGFFGTLIFLYYRQVLGF
jgi:hypothetical protein